MTSFSAANAKIWLPVAGAVAGAAWKVIEPRTKEWSASARRARVLHDAVKRVEFWKLWVEAVSANGSSTDKEKGIAGREFAMAADEVERAFLSTRDVREWPVAEFLKYRGGLGRLRRFLMLYKEPSHRASNFRWFGYLLSLFLVAEAYAFNQIGVFVSIREALAGTWLAAVLTYLPYVVAPVMWYLARREFVKLETQYVERGAKDERAIVNSGESGADA